MDLPALRTVTFCTGITDTGMDTDSVLGYDIMAAYGRRGWPYERVSVGSARVTEYGTDKDCEGIKRLKTN